MLDSVRSILSSGRPDDAISGELAELLGLDNLELVTEILCNRGQFFKEQLLPSLPSKGKGKQPGSSRSFATGKHTNITVSDPKSLAPQQVRRRMEEQLQANASRPLFTGTAVSHTV
jgi:antiviral helicase SLH1